MRRPLVLLLLGLFLFPAFDARARSSAAEKKAWAEAKSAFSKGMRSSDPKVRVEAVRTLGRIGSLAAVELLVEKVLEK